MSKQILHITNGDNLTNYLKELDIEGVFLTWQEILCEGKTIAAIDSKAFLETRRSFLNEVYKIEIDDDAYASELKKLDDHEDYSEIILWFEYDLFCHINMIGVINLLHQREIKLPLFLVCSGRIEGEKSLKGLAELNSEQLLQHYEQKIALKNEDIELAIALWRTYCGKDHNIFKPYIVKTSSFPYMSNCLKAHLKRFPDSKSGLNILETNILELVKENDIKSRHHLLGYALNYQGYYGFGDIQFERLIDNLSIFFIEETGSIKLNRKGHEALLGLRNYAEELNNNISYGGVKRLDFQFNIDHNKLIKRI